MTKRPSTQTFGNDLERGNRSESIHNKNLFKDLEVDFTKLFSKAISDAFKNNKRSLSDLIKSTAEDAAKAGFEKGGEASLKLLEKRTREWQNQQKQDNLKTQNELLEDKWNKEKAHQKKSLSEEERERAKFFVEEYKKLMQQGTITSEQKEDLAKKEQELEDDKTYNVLKSIKDITSKISKSVDSQISQFRQYQLGVNTRLQGVSYESYDTYSRIVAEGLSYQVGIQPYFKNQDLLSNLSELVAHGIASNLEQRAFLETIKDNIATTFDVFDAALLRIIRLQQQDSTAARLGLENYLTKFLNSMYENTEYLSQSFDTVADALLSASSLMTMQGSTEFEYIVQKWLGSLVSVGFNSSTAQSLASAIGSLGSGNIDALSNSNINNLLVLAASRAGLSYGDLLTSGLNAESVNNLLYYLVSYLAEIGSQSNNVVKSQLANVFGIDITDLVAASNLQSSLNTIQDNILSYSGMYDSLIEATNTMASRMSPATMMGNLLANATFGIAQNIATSPTLSAIWELTQWMENATGGIDIPSVFGFDLNATVEDLIQTGIIGVSSLGTIGQVISGLGSTFSPGWMLGKLGITKDSPTISIERGAGLETREQGFEYSSLNYQASSNTDDILGNTFNDATNSTANYTSDLTQQAQESDYTYKLLNDDFLPNLKSAVDKLEKIFNKLDTGTINVDIVDSDIDNLALSLRSSLV